MESVDPSENGMWDDIPDGLVSDSWSKYILQDTLDKTSNRWGSYQVLDFALARLKPTPGTPKVSVTPETVQDAALRFRGRRVTVLNFASGVSPGGGVRWGSKAQEEALCLCSGLLWSLEANLPYYESNRAEGAPAECYDRMILTENVPLLKDGKFNPVEPMLINVITYPAPNVWKREYGGRGEFVQKAAPGETSRPTFARRCRHVVYTARKIQTEVLLLGAWGCGAYGNDPVLVAEEWVKALAEQAGEIPEVVHPVYGPTLNLRAFQEVNQTR